MRVLVTGVAGFVGQHLASHLAANGDQVIGTYLGERLDDPAIETFEVDILDREQLASVIDQTRPEAIVHLAGLSHVGKSWEQVAAYFRVNVVGTENLLACAGDARVLVASSAEAYGPVPEDEQPIPESRSLAPPSPYAMSKAAAERLVRRDGGIVVRPFNCVGPGQASEFAFPSFASQLAAIADGAQPPVLHVGNLEARRDFLHVRDAVEGYRLLIAEAEPGQAYNLGSGRAFSIRQGLDFLIEESGVQASVELDPDRFRPVDVPLLCADTSRLADLGFSPERDLRMALADLWASIRA